SVTRRRTRRPSWAVVNPSASDRTWSVTAAASVSSTRAVSSHRTLARGTSIRPACRAANTCGRRSRSRASFTRESADRDEERSAAGSEAGWGADDYRKCDGKVSLNSQQHRLEAGNQTAPALHRHHEQLPVKLPPIDPSQAPSQERPRFDVFQPAGG